MSRVAKLVPADELAYLRTIYGNDHARLLAAITRAFDVLQNRAQLLLSLVAVVLTITGFSGPTIAASSPISRFCISYGLCFVLASSVLILAGPLELRWATQWRAATPEESLVYLIRLRNSRTRKYHIAFLLLVVGLSGYVGSVIGYLFTS